MAEGLTREEYDSHHEITVEKSKRLPADDGEHDTLVLVRNDLGWWGTAIHCYGEEGPVEYDDVTWFIDEATAKRDFAQDETLECADCHICSRSMDSAVAKSPPGDDIDICPLCWARGEAEGDHV